VSGAADVEGLLARALAPVEPPEDLSARLRGALAAVTHAAAGELDGWELRAMRNPRRWARPALAAAGACLVALGLARRRGCADDPVGPRERSTVRR